MSAIRVRRTIHNDLRVVRLSFKGNLTPAEEQPPDGAEPVQPWLTPEEEAEWQKALAEQKAWELANWDAHCKKIEELFK